MKLKDIIQEGITLIKGPTRPEINIPIYTSSKFDYGNMKNVESVDVVLKASDTGNIYGRRNIAQNKVTKTSSKKWIK